MLGAAMSDQTKVIEDLKRWYLEPASRALSIDEVLTRSAERVVAAGFPLWRVATVIPTAHPDVLGLEAIWIRGEGCRLRPMQHQVMESAAYRESPVALVTASRSVLRVRLDDPNRPRFPLLEELARQGVTDYVIAPLELSGGQVAAYSFGSDHPRGFTDEQVEGLTSLMPILSMRHELRAATHALDSLLGLYLGKNAGQRVSAGAFRRGTGELIRAAIWYSDMRGFTSFGDRLPPQQLVELLDKYFTALGAPIEEHGGEILKFIGDGVLAIFPVVGDDPREPCRQALAAVRDAFSAMRSLNEERALANEPPIETGVALHLGAVMYGNIGGRERLDFTVIGRSVNEVARVEALCKQLGRPLLMTEPFARVVDDPTVLSLGEHELRGVSTVHEIFTAQS
jgi:adenylate cyclase